MHLSQRRPGLRSPRAAAVILAVLLLACSLGGGSNRSDLAILLGLRMLAALAIGVLVALGTGYHLRHAVRPLCWLVLACAILAAVQLVPLPPAVWTRLPGRATFVPAATLAGFPQPWRPISIVPDMTWNSLAAMLIPAAVLSAGTSMPADAVRRTLPWMLALGGASALLGVLQLGMGRNGPLYLYNGTADGLPIGLLANRNHQALLLAMMLPLLAAWCWTTGGRKQPNRYRLAIAGVVTVVLLPVVLATGSRSGLVLTGLALVAAAIVLPWQHIDQRRRKMVAVAMLAILVAMALTTALAGRALVFARLLAVEDVSTEMRVASMPTTWRLMRANLPLGTGLGSFDPMFRTAEPDTLLTATFRNHAHNDLLELAMTAGLPGLALLLGAMLWLARTAWRIWRQPHDGQRALGLAGVACLLLTMLASLSDYPLRVPLVEAVFVLIAIWVADASQRMGATGTGTGTDSTPSLP